ncbi:Tn7-like element transposition protein TnsE [Sutcliffiella halmapala]
MKLRPWTFDRDEEIVLKWIGNVKITEGQWRIRAAFEFNSQIEILEFPIAALPLLKVGAFYKDGEILESSTTGIIYDVKIPELNQCKVINSLDACKEVNYFLHAKQELMSQLVFEFTVEGKTYYLPQFEFIRAVFTVNKMITNAMMQPNGLEWLVKDSRLNYTKAYLELDDDISNNIAKDEDFIRYFAWLYFSPEIKATFESIYTLLSFKVNNNEELKLKVRLPDILNTHIQFRGIQKGDKYLILQWLGSDMEGTTFTDIEVKHKAFKKRIDAPGERKYRKSLKEDAVENILSNDPTKRSKQDANQPIEDLQSTHFQFGIIANVHKVYGDTQEVNQGDIYISNEGQGGGIQKQQQIVGLDESVYGGTIQPIDFKTLEVTKDIRGQGLEKFIKMIQLLAKDAYKYQVAMNLVYLPLGRKFSFINESLRRCACVVKVKNRLTNKFQYVIEISTPDGKLLSTLIIYQSNFDESALKKLLMNLVTSSGSWNKEILKNLDCEKLKHTSNNYINWKSKLEMKLK